MKFQIYGGNEGTLRALLGFNHGNLLRPFLLEGEQGLSQRLMIRTKYMTRDCRVCAWSRTAHHHSHYPPAI